MRRAYLPTYLACDNSVISVNTRERARAVYLCVENVQMALDLASRITMCEAKLMLFCQRQHDTALYDIRVFLNGNVLLRTCILFYPS